MNKHMNDSTTEFMEGVKKSLYGNTVKPAADEEVFRCEGTVIKVIDQKHTRFDCTEIFESFQQYCLTCAEEVERRRLRDQAWQHDLDINDAQEWFISLFDNEMLFQAWDAAGRPKDF